MEPKKVSSPKTTMELHDHILVDHEREVVGVNGRELKAIHAKMHSLRDDWDHFHGRKA